MRVLIWDSWILFYLPQFLLALVSPCFGFYMLQLLPASISTFFGIYSNPSSRRQSFNLGCIRHLVWNNHWLSRRINWCIRTSSTWSEEWCRRMFLGRRCRKWRDWEWNQSIVRTCIWGPKTISSICFFLYKIGITNFGKRCVPIGIKRKGWPSRDQENHQEDSSLSKSFDLKTFGPKILVQNVY